MIISYYDYFIYIILFVKLIYFICLFSLIYMKYIKKDMDDKYILIIDFMKNRFEFIFLMLIAILLIIIFNPFIKKTVKINNITKTLIFLYAIIIILNFIWIRFMNNCYFRINI